MSERKRVLIVVSSYQPAMIADMQRARMLAWELPKLGWDVEILTPGAPFQHPSYLDADSATFFPSDVTVHTVCPWLPGLFSILGMRSVGWRALKPMGSLGLQLLKTRRFELVYFSTTQFCLFLLGSYWRKKTGVPFVLDFHDPYYQEEKGAIATTKHTFKREVSRRLAKSIELKAVREASALVSVSPVYINALKTRYRSLNSDWLRNQLLRTIPFAAREGDCFAVNHPISSRDNNASGALRIIYVGAGGGLMLRAFTLICRALDSLRRKNNPLLNRVRIELYGTMSGWREGDVKPLEQVAIEQGVGDLVKEYPSRISYRRSLELLSNADGALILGVNDSAYMPSKLFSYALSGHPLLASLRRDSPAYAHFQRAPELGHALWFEASDEIPIPEAADEVDAFLKETAERRIFDRRVLLQPYLAPAMAQQHVDLFDACLRDN